MQKRLSAIWIHSPFTTQWPSSFHAYLMLPSKHTDQNTDMCILIQISFVHWKLVQSQCTTIKHNAFILWRLASGTAYLSVLLTTKICKHKLAKPSFFYGASVFTCAVYCKLLALVLYATLLKPLRTFQWTVLKRTIFDYKKPFLRFHGCSSWNLCQ